MGRVGLPREKEVREPGQEEVKNFEEGGEGGGRAGGLRREYRARHFGQFCAVQAAVAS